MGNIVLALFMLAFISVYPVTQVTFAEESDQPAATEEPTSDADAGSNTEETNEEMANLTNENTDDNENKPETDTSEDSEVLSDEEHDNGADDNETGENGEDGTPSEDAGAFVETGAAAAGTEMSNDINTNIIDTTASSTVAMGTEDAAEDGDAATTTAATTTVEAFEEQQETGTTTLQNTEISENQIAGADSAATTTLSIENKNHATSTTAATSTAETGENTAETKEGTASIGSGNASAFANVANTANSNFAGSNGMFQFLNLFGSVFGDLTLSFDAGGASCSFLCHLTELFIKNYNDADVANNVAVEAHTGGNMAASIEGDAGIITGDAFAAANVVNMVNTNVVGSEYLAFIMNAFGSWEGDLVLPPGSFWKNSSSSLCCFAGDMSVGNENTAAIENNTDTNASSGENNAETTGGGSALVETGNAAAVNNVMTIANTNIFGNNMLLVYVRTGGSWRGNIFSLPSGVNIIGTGDGFIIDGFSSLAGGGIGNGVGSTTIRNTNNARIINNVSATASTGGNTATGGSNAAVSTGNAFAATNVVNIANTNIIGRNWLLAIVNVFNGWTGDVAFGRPDLWVGASAEGPTPLSLGDMATFEVAYRNNGNAPATGVEIAFDFGESLNILDAGGGTVTGTRVVWDTGTVDVGDTGSFSFTAQAQDSTVGDFEKSVSAAADMFEDDGNTIDNTDELKLAFYNKPPPGFLGHDQIYARLEIAKERLGADLVYPGDEVEYKITIDNKGAGHAYNVVVEDEMKNAAGGVISTQGWDLDTVYPGEKIIIEYTVQFASTTPAGTYTNYALAEWYDENGNYVDHSGHQLAIIEVGETPAVPEENLPGSAPDNSETGTATSTASDSMVGRQGGSGDTGTTTPQILLSQVPENTPQQASTASRETPARRANAGAMGGREADILSGTHPVYVSDARPLDTSFRGELNRSRRSPWDPRNLAANISLAGMGYTVLWALLVAIVVYLVTRRRTAQ